MKGSDLILEQGESVEKKVVEMKAPFYIHAENLGFMNVLLTMSQYENGYWHPVFFRLLEMDGKYKGGTYPPGTYHVILNCLKEPYTGCDATVSILTESEEIK